MQKNICYNGNSSLGKKNKTFSCFRKCWRDAVGKPRGDVSQTPSAASSSPSQIKFGWRRSHRGAFWGSPGWQPLVDLHTALATLAGRRWMLQNRQTIWENAFLLVINIFEGNYTTEGSVYLKWSNLIDKKSSELFIVFFFYLLAIESGSFPCCVILRAFLTASTSDGGVCNH